MTEIEALPLCDVSFNASKWTPHRKDVLRLLGEAMNHVRGQFPQFKTVGHIDVILADDPFVQDLNDRYRGKNHPTNVLSFPQADFKKGAEQPTHDFVLLGDIVMAFDVIEEEATKEGKDFLHHFCHLFIHGCLHLLGFDHETDEDQVEMEALETKLLAAMHIKNPYETEY